MKQFLLRRLLIIPFILVLVSFLGFSYAHLVRPIRAARTPYLVAETPLAGKLGESYTRYLKGLLSMDLGSMAGSDQSVLQAILRAGAASAGLLGIVLVLSLTLGGILGLVGARADPSRVAQWVPFLSTVGLAMPSFFAGSLLVVAVIGLTLSRPGSGFFLPPEGFGWDKHLILPTATLMLRPTLYLASVVSGLLVFEFDKQYVTTARSQGNPWNVIRRRHALRNVLAPIVTSIALSTRLLVGELVLVEWLFDWPGLGSLLAQTLIPSQISFRIGSALFLDPPLVATVITTITALFLGIDLVNSGLVRILDPRLMADVQDKVAAA